MTGRRCGREDWIITGLVALSEGGIEAVKIERLASCLGTSKGSFYWHFTDRSALLIAMLDFWEAEGTGLVITSTETVKEPAERLRAVAGIALIVTERGLDISRTEAALRAWAAEDLRVAERLAQVDKQRVNYISGTLESLGYDSATADLLGRGIYLALMGLYNARRYAPSLADNQAFLALVEGILNSAPLKGKAAMTAL
jgi:AcrR family transcriptional regulator